MTTPTISYAGADVLAKPVHPAVPSALPAPGTTGNVYQQQYAELSRQDAAELLTVSTESPQAAFDNVASVLAQASALQGQPHTGAAGAPYSYKNDTNVYDVLNLPTIEAQIGASDRVAYAAIDRAVTTPRTGAGSTFDLTA